MRTNSGYTQSKHKESTPRSNPENDSIIKVIDKVEKVDQRYSDLSKTMAELEDYDSIHLAEYEPTDRYKRRHWIDALKLSHTLCKYRMPYGGNIGTMTFIWKIPTKFEDRDETKQSQTILKITNTLPSFPTRQMQRNYIDKCSTAVKKSGKSVRHVRDGDPSAQTKKPKV